RSVLQAGDGLRRRNTARRAPAMRLIRGEGAPRDYTLTARCATVYDAAGNLNVMRPDAAGASSRCGATFRGCSNVLNAFRSGPVSVSHVSTRDGLISPQSSAT